MSSKTVRKVVRIDEDRCDGCGACIIACAEGALEIINGKARLVSEKYCDGLGNCLSCPRGAISIEERPAEAFDEEAVQRHLQQAAVVAKATCPLVSVFRSAGTGDRAVAYESVPDDDTWHFSQWPVQLALVAPGTPFLEGADQVLAADCVAYAYTGFHRDFLDAKSALLVACPKLDDFAAHRQRLSEILRHRDVRSLTVVHMEVPCCSGLVHLAKQSIEATGRQVPLRDITISTRGERVG